MVAALEKSLAKQVERGKLEETAAKEIARAGHRHRRPPRPRTTATSCSSRWWRTWP